MMEMPYHDSTAFVTLTYDDSHLPRTFAADPATGEALTPIAPLVPADFTNFVKRLRRRFPSRSLRIFGCGEYGNQSFRPHYHLIVFGLPLDDFVPLSKSRLGDQYYRSPLVESCWTDDYGSPIGYCVSAPASWKSCAYVARYVLKKQLSDDQDCYAVAQLPPPFIRMSRRPGIGARFYDDHPDMMTSSLINVSTPDGGVSFPAPLYFRRKLAQSDPYSAYWYALERQKSAQDRYNLELQQLTGLDAYDKMLLDRDRHTRKIKQLRRLL